MFDLRILIVDDTPLMRNIIIKTLRRAGFLNVTAAVDAYDALTKLKEEEFDFVITDWKMPQLDGPGLVREIRSNPKLKSLPVLLITCQNIRTEALKVMKAGVTNYIVKPFTSVTLANKIEQVLKTA